MAAAVLDACNFKHLISNLNSLEEKIELRPPLRGTQLFQPGEKILATGNIALRRSFLKSTICISFYLTFYICLVFFNLLNVVA